jgi:cytochrome c biogenesis protein CcmG, thiol:disulfide interchange protein DsbE
MGVRMLRRVRVAGLLLAVLAGWLVAPKSAPAEPSLDQPAPALVITRLDGSRFDLGQLRGKVVLVNYWASWCIPCRKEMPRLDAYYRQHHDQGLEIIGISVDRPGQRAKVIEIMSGLAYPAAMASDVMDDGFGKPKGVPSTFVIDRAGVVRDKFIDVYDQLLTDVVLPLLAH